MDTPVPIDLYDVATDPDQLFRVRLYTNAPANDTPLNQGGFTEPTDTQYVAQDVAYAIEDQDENTVRINLAPAAIETSKYTTAQTVAGYFVSAIFDDGESLIGFYPFSNPVILTNLSGNLVVEANLDVFDTGDNIDLNWS